MRSRRPDVGCWASPDHTFDVGGYVGQAAIDWAHGSDQRNADLVERTRHLADLQVTLPEA